MDLDGNGNYRSDARAAPDVVLAVERLVEEERPARVLEIVGARNLARCPHPRHDLGRFARGNHLAFVAQK